MLERDEELNTTELFLSYQSIHLVFAKYDGSSSSLSLSYLLHFFHSSTREAHMYNFFFSVDMI